MMSKSMCRYDDSVTSDHGLLLMYCHCNHLSPSTAGSSRPTSATTSGTLASHCEEPWRTPPGVYVCVCSINSSRQVGDVFACCPLRTDAPTTMWMLVCLGVGWCHKASWNVIGQCIGLNMTLHLLWLYRLLLWDNNLNVSTHFSVLDGAVILLQSYYYHTDILLQSYYCCMLHFRSNWETGNSSSVQSTMKISLILCCFLSLSLSMTVSLPVCWSVCLTDCLNLSDYEYYC